MLTLHADCAHESVVPPRLVGSADIFEARALAARPFVRVAGASRLARPSEDGGRGRRWHRPPRCARALRRDRRSRPRRARGGHGEGQHPHRGRRGGRPLRAERRQRADPRATGGAHARAGEQTQAEGRRGDYGRRGGARAAAAARRARDAVREGPGDRGTACGGSSPTGRGGRGRAPRPEDAGVVPESQAVAQKEVFYTEGSAELAAAPGHRGVSMPRAAARRKRLRAARDTARPPREDPEGAAAAPPRWTRTRGRAAFLETDARCRGRRPLCDVRFSRGRGALIPPRRTGEARCGAPSGASVSPCARRRSA